MCGKRASGAPAANETSLRAEESSIDSSKAFDGYANERTSERASAEKQNFSEFLILTGAWDHRERMKFAEDAITLRKRLP